jgi:hypothetical protein
MVHYKALMSRAVWRPAPGRKLAFLVTHGEHLLGLIFLASPVIRLAARDDYLFPNVPKDFDYGTALRSYMDMSVCVGAQPIAWHWHVGKLCALIAPTLGDFIEQRYPDELKGVTTTSLYGRGSQYKKIYEYLGKTKGYGHEHISDEVYAGMLEKMRDAGIEIPSSKMGEGSNPRMRRIMAFKKHFPHEWADMFGDTPKAKMNHGNLRGVYYHEAIDPSQRRDVIEHWYERWGLPRFEQTKDQTAPYQSGLETRAPEDKAATEGTSSALAVMTL